MFPRGEIRIAESFQLVDDRVSYELYRSIEISIVMFCLALAKLRTEPKNRKRRSTRGRLARMRNFRGESMTFNAHPRGVSRLFHVNDEIKLCSKSSNGSGMKSLNARLLVVGAGEVEI